MQGILITGLRTILHNTLRCVEKAGLEIVDIALEPMAAGALFYQRMKQILVLLWLIWVEVLQPFHF